MACCTDARLAGGADSGVRANVSAETAASLPAEDLADAGASSGRPRRYFATTSSARVRGRSVGIIRGEAVEIGRADHLGHLRERPAVLDQVTGGQELDHLAQPEQRLASLALGRRQHAHLHVVPHEAFVGRARVVGERGDARQHGVEPVGQLGGGAAPVGEIVGQGEEDGVHGVPVYVVSVSGRSIRY